VALQHGGQIGDEILEEAALSSCIVFALLYNTLNPAIGQRCPFPTREEGTRLDWCSGYAE